MLELMQLARPPRRQRGVTFTQHHLANLTDPLGSMGEIQNAQRLGTVEIDKMLNPFGAIVHRCEPFGLLHAAPVEFGERQALKRLGFSYAREVRMRVRWHNSLP